MDAQWSEEGAPKIAPGKGNKDKDVKKEKPRTYEEEMKYITRVDDGTNTKFKIMPGFVENMSVSLSNPPPPTVGTAEALFLKYVVAFFLYSTEV